LLPALADHRFWVALGIAMLAGVVRGFSGFFGANLHPADCRGI
jgi:hypothetical protein